MLKILTMKKQPGRFDDSEIFQTAFYVVMTIINGSFYKTGLSRRRRCASLY